MSGFGVACGPSGMLAFPFFGAAARELETRKREVTLPFELPMLAFNRDTPSGRFLYSMTDGEWVPMPWL